MKRVQIMKKMSVFDCGIAVFETALWAIFPTPLASIRHHFETVSSFNDVEFRKGRLWDRSINDVTHASGRRRGL